MKKISSGEKSVENPKTTSHLANERTFLAWIRTSIALMALGFVLERFNLFIKQLTIYFEKIEILKSNVVSHFLKSYSSFFGEFLVCSGLVLGLFAFLMYTKTKNEIESDSYTPSVLLVGVLTAIITFVGLFLIVFLWET